MHIITLELRVQSMIWVGVCMDPCHAWYGFHFSFHDIIETLAWSASCMVVQCMAFCYGDDQRKPQSTPVHQTVVLCMSRIWIIAESMISGRLVAPMMKIFFLELIPSISIRIWLTAAPPTVQGTCSWNMQTTTKLYQASIVWRNHNTQLRGGSLDKVEDWATCMYELSSYDQLPEAAM